MNLYLVSQNINNGYDTFDSFICAAESEQEARKTHPYGDEVEDNWSYHVWVSFDEINKLKVTKIGVADPSTPKGIILASFNAG